jgi:hypothetical protein
MNIPLAHVIDYADGGRRLAAGVPDDRAVLTDAARSALPAGTITIDADECPAMAVGDGTFLDAGLSGSFPGSQSVILPACIVAGPGLPVHIRGGSRAGMDARARARLKVIMPLSMRRKTVDGSGRDSIQPAHMGRMNTSTKAGVFGTLGVLAAVGLPLLDPLTRPASSTSPSSSGVSRYCCWRSLASP